MVFGWDIDVWIIWESLWFGIPLELLLNSFHLELYLHLCHTSQSLCLFDFLVFLVVFQVIYKNDLHCVWGSLYLYLVTQLWTSHCLELNNIKFLLIVVFLVVVIFLLKFFICKTKVFCATLLGDVIGKLRLPSAQVFGSEFVIVCLPLM